MREARRDLLVGGRHRHPELEAVQALAAGAMVGRGALGMHDAAPGRHQVDVARMDGGKAAEAVAVHDLAVEQERHGGEPDMGMRPHVDALAGAELDRPEMIEEDERADHAALDVGQRAADREAAEIDAARHDHEIDGVGGRRVAGGRIRVGRETHGELLTVSCSALVAPSCVPPPLTRRRAARCRSACRRRRA